MPADDDQLGIDFLGVGHDRAGRLVLGAQPLRSDVDAALAEGIHDRLGAGVRGRSESGGDRRVGTRARLLHRHLRAEPLGRLVPCYQGLTGLVGDLGCALHPLVAKTFQEVGWHIDSCEHDDLVSGCVET